MKDRLHFLDVARGIAALLVLFAHGFVAHVPAYLPWSFRHSELGRIGVLLFLVISGYIIPHSLQQGGSNARFWLRRCFRLLPLYWFSILLVYCRFKVTGFSRVPTTDVETWLVNLTMLQGFTGHANILGVFWTLHLELVIYLSCSILFQLRLLGRHWLLAGVGLLVFAGYRVYNPGAAYVTLDFGGKQSFYVAALIGLMAHRLSTERQGMSKLVVLMVSHIALMVWLSDYRLGSDATLVARLLAVLYNWGPVYGGFLLLLAMRDFRMPRFARRLGEISYSVYLLHPIVLTFLKFQLGWAGQWYFMPCLIVGSLALGELAFRFVEAPGIALGRRLESRLWPPTGTIDSLAPAPAIAPAPAPLRRAA